MIKYCICIYIYICESKGLYISYVQDVLLELCDLQNTTRIYLGYSPVTGGSSNNVGVSENGVTISQFLEV